MTVKKSSLSIAALFFLLAGDCVLQAQTDIRVQTTTDGSGTALQAGWDLVDGGRNTSPISGTVDGVTITMGAEGGTAFGRSAGADGGGYLSVDHTDGDLDNLLSGGRFTNAAQDLTLTLSGLPDGDYQITTYHHSPFNGSFDGVFEFDVLLTDANGTGVLVHDDLGNSQGASVTTAGLAAVVTSFAVSGGNDVTLAFSPDAGFDTGDGSDQMYLNGFELVDATDSTPPALVLPTSPADGATGVPVVSDLVATFDESVALEDGGTITIRDLGPGPDVVITLPDARVSVVGANLTISPAGNLVINNPYAVQISGDAVRDLAATPNFFAGISDDTTWSFTTAADGTPPAIFTTNPADEATDVAINTILVATFDETIMIGVGDITIRNLTDAIDTVIPVGDARVSVSGADLIIDPVADLDPGDDYAIRIDAGAVTDTIGNPFAGIADDTTWNFTTAADTIAPTLTATDPANGAPAVSETAGLVATFSEPIMAAPPTVLHHWDFDTDDGGFTLKSGGSGTEWAHGTPDSVGQFGGSVTADNSGSGQCWATGLGDFTNDPTVTGRGYYADPTTTCLRSPVIDLTNVTSAQLTFSEALDVEASDTAVVRLIDDTSDTVIATVYTAVDGNPNAADWAAANGGVAIDLAAGIGQEVRLEWCLGDPATAGTTKDYMGWYIDDVRITVPAIDSNITIRNLTDMTDTVIPVGDPQVSISGNTLTVNPAAPLGSFKDYAVRIDSNALTDLYDNPFAGIGDDTTWSFTTRSLTGTLFVDIQSNAPPPADAVTQAGWTAWELPATFNTTVHSTTFTYAPATGGSLGVSLTPATNAGARNYGLDNISDPGNLRNPNVWFDQYFWNNNTSGALTLTLDNLTAGIYQFTSYHYADDLALAPAGVAAANDEGTASVFLDIGSGFTDTGMDVTMTVGVGNGSTSRNLSAAQVMADGTFTTSFTVANDGDPIRIRYQNITGGDSFGLNGFELWPTDGGGGGGNNFSDWIAGFNVGDLNGIGDDPDGDGIDNGVENYFGTAPDTFSQGLIPGAVDKGANTFTFTHPLNDNPADDLTAIYRWSTDLQTFHDDGDPNGAGTTTVNFAQGTPSGGMVTVTATLSGTVIPDKLFVAVAVTQNP